MKNLLLYSLLVCCFLSACSQEKATESAVIDSPIPVAVIDLAPADFASKSKAGVLIDVRTPEEVAAGAIEGSIAMDYNQGDFAKQIDQLPKDGEIYLYCGVGGRSSKAADMLIQQGFTKVYNLEGGITAWTAAGLPVAIPE